VTDDLILMQVRLPRALGAALVGAALGVSGALFQGLLRNPLADPLLLGTSSGAALGAVVALVITSTVTVEWLGFSLVALLAFLGALLAVALVYGLATRGGRTPVVTLLLAGVVVSALLTAAQTLLIVLETTLQQHFGMLYFWFSGAVSVESWAQLGVVAALLAVGLLAALWLAPTLDAFALGEEMAGHLGVRVEQRKLLIVAAASLLVAASVTIGGLVGFVGLLAPHASRLLLGPRSRPLVMASALGGAIFVTLADLLARTIVAPTELPLGVITAFVGGPFFLWLLRSAGQRYRW
jgi:iron complex transport system permease protein